MATKSKTAKAASAEKSRLPDLLTIFAFIGDTGAVITGLFLGFWLRFNSGWITIGVRTEPSPLENYLGLILTGAVFLLASYAWLGLYNQKGMVELRKVLFLIVKGLVIWFFIYLGTSLALKFQPPISRLYVSLSFLCCLITMIIWRMCFYQIIQTDMIRAKLRKHVLFIGWNQDTANLHSELVLNPTLNYNTIGAVSMPNGCFDAEPPLNVHRLAHYNDIKTIIMEGKVDVLILTEVDLKSSDVATLANLCEKEYVQFKIVPTYFQIMVSNLKLETISSVSILGVDELPLEYLSNRILKRFVDIAGSILGLTLSIPIITMIGALIYFESPGTIFFRQERIGRLGRRFKILKLRSMKLGAEKNDHLNQSTLRNDHRLLRVGQFIRRWNLDELPQFLNVLVGDMSLVGPRPERTFHTEQLSEKIPHYNARHKCKPGMTGWAQVHGWRGDTDLVERVKHDIWYLENWNILFDFQIMIQTFFIQKNAY